MTSEPRLQPDNGIGFVLDGFMQGNPKLDQVCVFTAALWETVVAAVVLEEEEEDQ